VDEHCFFENKRISWALEMLKTIGDQKYMSIESFVTSPFSAAAFMVHSLIL
jgi:hypothetical protein